MVKKQEQDNKKAKEEKELLNPKNDYVFKRIFGHVGNEDITKGLLTAIIKEKIEDITLDCNPITEKDLFDDKIGILDIKAKLNNNINCNIELQIVDKKNIEKRILFYWSKMYVSSIKEGLDYEKLEKGIVILLTDYNIKPLKKIKKYLTKWNIREEENPKIILTDALEIYIIELEKVKDNIEGNNMLNLWLQFIKNPKAVSDMENKEIKQAREELEKISQDKRERYLTELREKYIMDQKAIEDAGYDKGLEVRIQQGIQKGIQQGIQKGAKDEKNEIAKKLKEQNIDINIIINVTGLTKEEIEKI